MSKKRKINPFLLLRLLGVVLFIIILFRVDLKEVFSVLKNTDPGFLFLGIFFQILVLAFKGIRWHLMNDGRKQKQYWMQSLGRFFESYAIGIVTPGRLGELLKAGHEDDKHQKAGAFLRVISERGFDVGIFVFVAVLALITGQFIQLQNWLIVLLLLFSIGLLVFAWLILTSPKTLNLLQQVVGILPGKLSSLELTAKQYKQGSVLTVFLLSVLSNISYFISCYYLAMSVGLLIPILEVSGGVAIAGLFNMLPITVMGLGTREATFLTLFSGFDQSAILAFSFAMLIVAQLGGGLVSLIAGFLFLQKDKNQKRKHEEG